MNTIRAFKSQDSESLAKWLTLRWDSLEAVRRVKCFVLLDLAPLSRADRQSAIDQFMLVGALTSANIYGDLDGLEIAQIGPRLIEVGRDLLPFVAELSLQKHNVSFIFSELSVDGILAHLQRIREVLLPDGSQALFRFQDVNVLSHLAQVLTPGMTNKVLGPALSWVVPDICGCVFELRPRPGFQRNGDLRFDKRTLEELNNRLLAFTVIDQINDVDSSLLSDMSRCEQTEVVSQKIEMARNVGLKSSSDIALFAVLGMQLPPDFYQVEPFLSAIEQAKLGQMTFSNAIDRVSQTEWNQWNEKHSA